MMLEPSIKKIKEQFRKETGVTERGVTPEETAAIMCNDIYFLLLNLIANYHRTPDGLAALETATTVIEDKLDRIVEILIDANKAIEESNNPAMYKS